MRQRPIGRFDGDLVAPVALGRLVLRGPLPQRMLRHPPPLAQLRHGRPVAILVENDLPRRCGQSIMGRLVPGAGRRRLLGPAKGKLAARRRWGVCHAQEHRPAPSHGWRQGRIGPPEQAEPRVRAPVKRRTPLHLPLPDKVDEAADVHQPVPLRRSKGFVQATRDDQLQGLGLHLVSLVFGDPRLKRQQVLLLNALRFGQHLPPSILQRGLGAQHSRARVWKRRVGVMGRAGKQEVRPVAIFGLCAARVANPLRLKDRLEMVLQRLSGPGLAPVLDAQRKRQEAVDIHGVRGLKTASNPFGDDPAFKTPEQLLLPIQPVD